MAKVERVKTLEDVKVWVADHDATSAAWWQSQREWNERVDKKIADLNVRLTAAERRLIYVAGAASAVGGSLGAGVLQVLAGF